MAREWFLYYFQAVFFSSSCHVSPVRAFSSSASECWPWSSGLWAGSSALSLATTTEVRAERSPPDHPGDCSYRNVRLWLWLLRQSWHDLDLAGFIRYLFGESSVGNLGVIHLHHHLWIFMSSGLWWWSELSGNVFRWYPMCYSTWKEEE